MQFTIATLAALLTAVSAVPSNVAPRQAVIAEIAAYTVEGCPNVPGQPGRNTTLFVTNAGSCQTFDRQDILSGFLDTPLPAGCRLQFHTDAGCNSAVNIEIPRDVVQGQCFGFGQRQPIRSVITFGC